MKPCPVIASGAALYAAERAAAERALAAKFRQIWYKDSGVAVRVVETAPQDEEAEDEDGLHFAVAADVDSDDERVSVVDSDED